MRRLLAAVAAATAVLVAVTACGSGGDGHDHAPMDENGGPTSALTTPPPPALPEQFASVDQNDPLSVMVAAAEALFSYWPADDASQGAGAERAAPLLDERFYKENKSGFTVLAPITGGQWDDWADAGAIVTAKAQITADDHPQDMPAKVSRVVAVKQIAATPDGRVLHEQTLGVYMSATRLGVWRVSAVKIP